MEDRSYFFIKGKVLVFGTGEICRSLVKYIKKEQIVGFLDNDKAKQGKLYEGMIVYAPQEGINLLDYDIVCIMTKYIDEITSQIVQLGVNANRIISYRQLLDEFEKNRRSMFYTKQHKISLDSIDKLFCGHVALFKDDYSVLEIFKYISHEYIVLKDDYIPDGVDVIACHGLSVTPYIWDMYHQASKRKIPIVMFEDGFLRSIFPAGFHEIDKMVFGHSIILDGRGLYINAYTESEMERILNSDIEFNEKELERAQQCIDNIIKNKLSKYNNQLVTEKLPRNEKTCKVLIIDQVPEDKSITFGMAGENTFQKMLAVAIKENPEADIFIKKHPVAKKTHYSKANAPNVYLMENPINPIVLLESVDKVYVCTSQMGFEALMCGKEVHVFGMPFYAGWGVTIDSMVSSRRKRKRSVQEIFYVAYILLTKYVSFKKGCRCEIEDVMDELISLRSEYFDSLK